VPFDFTSVRATLDMLAEPVLETGTPCPIAVELANSTPAPLAVTVTWRLPEGIRALPSTQTVELPPQGHEVVAVRTELQADELPRRTVRGTVELAPQDRPGVWVIPVALGTVLSVGKDDWALASRGATATSDSEYERESGCTQRVIDGVIATENDFEGKRWHAALTPHPHWIAVHLPEPRSIGRVVLHFADPQGHPVDFVGEVSLDGENWRAVFEETGYGNAAWCEKAFIPTEARHFRLTIRRSASPRWPDAAQLSEIELLPG
jgi:hypothetical protein